MCWYGCNILSPKLNHSNWSYWAVPSFGAFFTILIQTMFGIFIFSLSWVFVNQLRTGERAENVERFELKLVNPILDILNRYFLDKDIFFNPRISSYTIVWPRGKYSIILVLTPTKKVRLDVCMKYDNALHETYKESPDYQRMRIRG